MFGGPDRLEGLMHSRMLQEPKCGRSGNVSNLENIFHSYFGGQGCMSVGIPLSGLKSRFTFLCNKRIKEKSKTPHSSSPCACTPPQNWPLGTEIPGGWGMHGYEHSWVFISS